MKRSAGYLIAAILILSMLSIVTSKGSSQSSRRRTGSDETTTTTTTIIEESFGQNDRDSQSTSASRTRTRSSTTSSTTTTTTVRERRHTDNESSGSRTERRTSASRVFNSGSRYEEIRSVREELFDFLRRPEGLSVSVGYSRMGYGNYFDWQMTETNDIDTLLFHNAEFMNGFQLGFALGNSFINLRISPYMPGTPNLLYLEAETGVWFLGNNQIPRTGFFYKVGFIFFGSLLSFKEPLITASQINVYDSTIITRFNNGLGMTYVASTLPSAIGFNILDIVRVEMGAYIRLGVILPVQFVLGIGIIGPNVTINFIPGKLSAYLNWRPFKIYNSGEQNYSLFYDMTAMDIGLTYHF